MLKSFSLAAFAYAGGLLGTAEGTETLRVREVSEEGFGYNTNQYAFAMTEFQGSLYVGTLNAELTEDLEITIDEDIPPIEIDFNVHVILFFLGLEFPTESGTQFWCGDIVDTDDQGENVWEWNRLLTGSEGDLGGLSSNYGIRKFHAVGDWLYMVTGNHILGFELWRWDGEEDADFEVVIQGGFGDPDSTSGRGLTSYNGYLIVGVENRLTAAKMLARKLDPDTGDFADGSDWFYITQNGFGFDFNWWFSDFAEFNGYLYSGTLNPGGMQLWRSANGTDWENIFIRGADHPMNVPIFLEFLAGPPFYVNLSISSDSAAMDLYVFKNKLYLGTMNFIFGASLWVTENGVDFEPVFVGGNGDSANAYVWSMQGYYGRLYVGTFNYEGEFQLFSSANPGVEPWVIETEDAYETEHYGTRTMTLFEGKLMIGTATASNPSGCLILEASHYDPDFPFNECTFPPIYQCESEHCGGTNSEGEIENPNCRNQKPWGCANCGPKHFKRSVDIPCIACDDIDHCDGSCSSPTGCNQCEPGHRRYWDFECKLFRCDPPADPNDPEVASRSECPVEGVSTVCETYRCTQDNDAGVFENPQCKEDERFNWGCRECEAGYFREAFYIPCVECAAIDGCLACKDWGGCTLCQPGKSLKWSKDCNMKICV